MYKLSVILPVYGVREFLPAALETLKQQTIGFENLQIIFADDCSKDGSWEVVQQYAQEYPNVECVRLEANSGGCGAPRNKGMELAVAPYIVYMDPDDLLPPSAYQDLYTEMLRTDAEIVTGWYDIQTEDGTILAEKCAETFSLPEDRDFCMPQDLEASFATLPMVCCKIYRRDFLLENKIAFMPKIPGEDQVYTVECYLHAKKVHYINKCVYHYVKRKQEQQSLSSNLSENYFEGIRICIETVKQVFAQAEQITCGERFTDALLEEQMRLLCITQQLPQKVWQKQYEAFLPHLKRAKGTVCKLLAGCESSAQAWNMAAGLCEMLLHEREIREYANALRCERDRILQELMVYKEWTDHLLESEKELQEAVQTAKNKATDLQFQTTELEKKFAELEKNFHELQNSRSVRLVQKMGRLLRKK